MVHEIATRATFKAQHSSSFRVQMENAKRAFRLLALFVFHRSAGCSSWKLFVCSMVLHF